MGNTLNRKIGAKNNSNSSLNLGVGLSSNNPNSKYGSIKRSSSSKRNNIEGPNDRPSTAPQKNDKNEEKEKTLNHHNSMKRLPSPNVKCKIIS